MHLIPVVISIALINVPHKRCFLNSHIGFPSFVLRLAVACICNRSIFDIRVYRTNVALPVVRSGDDQDGSIDNHGEQAVKDRMNELGARGLRTRLQLEDDGVDELSKRADEDGRAKQGQTYQKRPAKRACSPEPDQGTSSDDGYGDSAGEVETVERDVEFRVRGQDHHRLGAGLRHGFAEILVKEPVCDEFPDEGGYVGGGEAGQNVVEAFVA